MKTLTNAVFAGGLALTGAGALLTLTPSASLAGTLIYNSSFGFQNTDFLDTLIVPQYNGTQPLLSIQVIVRSDAQGIYTLLRTGGNNISYGLTADDVGASVFVTGPNNSITLNPVPIQNIGTGLLTATNPSLNLPITGTDTKSGFVNSSFFGSYTGAGNVTFDAEAISNIIVSKSGTPFSENATIEANANLQIIYTFQDAPPVTGVPEPSTLLGLLAVGGTGLVSRRRKK